MNTKLVISLYDLIGAAVIIKYPTGVMYTNQTCGTACLQPRIEGALLPVNNEFDPKFPEESIEVKLLNLLNNCNRLTSTQANELDDLLSLYPQTEGIHVDQKLLNDSHESWVHVVLKQSKYAGFSGAEELCGVLTWPNSD